MSDKEDKINSDTESRLKIGEMMKDIALGGLATYFMTEDAIRGYLKELKLPKELVGQMLDGASKKKDDFYGLLVKEFGKMLSKVDLTKEISRFMETHHINVSAKVSFEPKDSAVKPTEKVADKQEA